MNDFLSTPIHDANSAEEMNNLIDLASINNLVSVVLFTAPAWCRPCQQMEPHFLRAAENSDDIIFIRVDIDNNPWAVEEYGVKSVPQCWLFDKDGNYQDLIKVPQGSIPFLKEIREYGNRL